MIDGTLSDNFFIRQADRSRKFNIKDINIDQDKRMYEIQINGQRYYAKECRWETFES